MFKRVRYFIFLRDIFILSVTAFGGPHGHLAMMFDMLVKKRGYLSEADLIELNALCQILPGPTSTQMITALGFRIGGPNLAYLTLLVWMLPAVSIMTFAAIMIHYIEGQELSLDFTRFLQPIAVGFVAFAAYKITRKVVRSKTAWFLMLFSLVVSVSFSSPYVFPLLIIVGAATSALKYKRQPKIAKQALKIEWSNFILWAGVFIGAAFLGAITGSLPIRLFENFYRTGSLIFGGGQVLIPFLYAEFVELKDYLTSEEFLTGYALGQSIPGPTFSFVSYVGAFAMSSEGIGGQLLGGFVAALGIFLPGTFLIFFVIRFWEALKKYRGVRASLEGVNAISSGMVIAAAILLFMPMYDSVTDIAIMIATFALLSLTRIPAPAIIAAGLLAGIFIG